MSDDELIDSIRADIRAVKARDTSRILVGGPDLAAIRNRANAALPDDDPRKITWADVRECEQMAIRVNYDIREGNPWAKLAAKLAALLPPE